MSYKTKPQIKLYAFQNNAFVLQAIIDDFQEVSFERNLYQAGTFTISINYNIPNSQLFQRGLFVQFGNDPYDFGEIITINDSIGADGKGSQIRTITGYDARYILKRRVIKNMNSNGLWVMTAKGELCLRNLIKDQCGSGAETKRQLPIINTIPASADAIGKEYSVSEQFTNLYEVCKTIATQSEIGWRLAFDGTSLTLECYQGTDRSQTVQFSTSFDSLADGQFTDSSESFSNAIYVGGKGQNDDRDIYEGENGTPSGLDRFESWDNQSSMTTESEYEAEALSMLTQYGQTIQMSGNGLAKCPYIYKEQYDVGDLITVAFSGKSAVVQILSVTEHWAWGSYDIQFSFGKPQNNLSEQLQLMLRKIQSASEKSQATDSVRWYTLPADSSMPKSDVTYNTIGFTGSVGSGKTFTLYLDNEKTGSKTYHVYFKQLGGKGKLTLTTGKAGATNLVMEIGTYVAIIYVDENGNITSQGMTATSSVSSGNSQPVTSGGVANAIQDVVDVSSSLPTDAILHYSFDDVPDYPDGTADVRLINNNTFDIQSTNYAFSPNTFSPLSNENGKLKMHAESIGILANNWFAYMPNRPRDKILKIKFRIIELSSNTIISIRNGFDKSEINCTKLGSYEISFVNNSTAQYPSIYFYIQNGNLVTLIIDEIYIGDGSYVTPIIDNTNGQWNSISQSGVAVQGVSGKGFRFLGNQMVTANVPKMSGDLTVSIWVEWNGSAGRYPMIASECGRLGATENWCVYFDQTDGSAIASRFGLYGTFMIADGLVHKKYHVVISVSGTVTKMYIDGVLKATATANNRVAENLLIMGNRTEFQDRAFNGKVDDLLIFDRALSDTEVLALYQNKANTPKYYDINNYNLKQIKDITAQSTDFADFQSRMAGLATRSLQLIEPTEEER